MAEAVEAVAAVADAAVEAARVQEALVGPVEWRKILIKEQILIQYNGI